MTRRKKRHWPIASGGEYARTAPATKTERPWYAPTTKWWSLLASGAASVLASWIVTGAFDDVERGMTGTLLVTLATTWIVPNDGRGTTMRRRNNEAGQTVVGVLIGLLLAALTYWLAAVLGLPAVLCVIAAVLVFIACAFGGGAWGGRRGV